MTETRLDPNLLSSEEHVQLFAAITDKPENDPAAVAKYSTYLRRFTFGPLLTQPATLSLEELAIHTLAMIHLKNGRTPLRFGAFLAALDGLLSREPAGLTEVREEIHIRRQHETTPLDRDPELCLSLDLLRWFESVLLAASEGKPIPAGPSSP
jgi:hypothetical protein